MNVRLLKRWKRLLKNRCFPVIVFLGAKWGVGRVIAGRPILGDPCIAADAAGTLKLSTATQTNKGMCFVFIAIFRFLLMAHRDGG
jgi:hypothetical protein